MMRPLVIGLVNNSPERAQPATERRFSRVLRAAAAGIEFQLRPFALAECDDPSGSEPDALIVTGMEPRAANLRHEPAWSGLTRIAGWARHRAVPVLWSCLAAHAAILHLDGIDRRRRPAKLSGVFACDLAAPEHWLAAGMARHWPSPHSRLYDVPEVRLVARGYTVVSRSDEAGVDIFAGPGAVPFVYFQGHPEYGAETLLLEYKRDVRRFLLGERDDYPAPPSNMLAAPVIAALAECRERAQHAPRDPAALEPVLRLLAAPPPPASWHGPAARIFSNWLSHLAAPTGLVAPAPDDTVLRALAPIEGD